MAGSKWLTIEFPPYQDVTDFPSLITGLNLQDEDFDVFWDNVLASGADIIAYDSSFTKLKRELVSIDTANKTMELYVKCNRSSTVATFIYINYDDAAGAETNDPEVWENSSPVILTDDTGEADSSPISRTATAPLTVTVTTQGDFNITVPTGASVTFISGTAAVTDSPKTLTANGSITVTGTGTIIMTVLGFVMVHHMNDNPDTSTIQDSTANNLDGTKKGAGTPVEAAGAFSGDKSQTFNGTDEYITANLVMPTELSIIVIAKTVDETEVQNLIDTKDTDTKNSWRSYISSSVLWANGWRYDNAGADRRYNGNHSELISNDTWFMYTATAKSGEQKAYLNTSSFATGTAVYTVGVAETPIYIGSNQSGATAWNGSIAEVRIMNTIISTAWRTATYNSLLNNADDYIVYVDKVFPQATGAGSITPSSTLGRLTAIGSGAGTVGIAGILARLTAKAVGSGSITPSGVLSRVLAIAVGGGSITPASTLGRTIFKSIGSGTVGIAGALSRSIFLSVGSGAVAISSTLSSIWKAFQAVGAGSITPSSVLGRLTKKALGDGSIAPSGLLNLKTNRGVGAGSIAPSSSLGIKVLLSVGSGTVAIASSLLAMAVRVLHLVFLHKNYRTVTLDFKPYRNVSLTIRGG